MEIKLDLLFHTSDLIDGIVKLMNTEYAYPINIGNNDEVTINEIAKSIISISEKILNKK